MAIRNITKLGKTVLRRPAKPVDLATIHSQAFRTLVADMIATMHAARGIGIAAPQIGVDLQLAIINEKDKPFVIINPQILKRSFRSVKAEEGCLSIPGVLGEVQRNTSITVSYLDDQGVEHTINPSGMLSRVFQHEIDHLNGTLFIDRMKSAPKDLASPGSDRLIRLS